MDDYHHHHLNLDRFHIYIYKTADSFFFSRLIIIQFIFFLLCFRFFWVKYTNTVNKKKSNHYNRSYSIHNLPFQCVGVFVDSFGFIFVNTPNISNGNEFFFSSFQYNTIFICVSNYGHWNGIISVFVWFSFKFKIQI